MKIRFTGNRELVDDVLCKKSENGFELLINTLQKRPNHQYRGSSCIFSEDFLKFSHQCFVIYSEENEEDECEIIIQSESKEEDFLLSNLNEFSCQVKGQIIYYLVNDKFLSGFENSDSFVAEI